jgi:hypothetical protein
MKRIIIIIIIIIVTISVILAGIWLLSRNKAQKSGTTPLSFREFITGKDGAVEDPGTTPGSLDSEFPEETPGGQSGTPSSPAETGEAPIPVATSTFTNNSSFTPSSGGVAGILDPELRPGSGNPILPGAPIGGNVDTDVSIVIVPGASTVVSSGCSEADQNITFTPQELIELRGLQNRFYKVATTLHTDADVAAELSNYDTFNAKLQKLTQLNQYCAQSLPRITDATLKKAVPTPFWRDAARDNLFGYFSGFPALPSNPLLGGLVNAYGGSFDLGDATKAQRNLELALRLSLW